MYGNQKYILNLINWYKFREEVRNGLPFLLGSGHPVGGGVRAADDRRAIIIPGEAASQGAVFGVWGLDGVGVDGIPPTYTSQEGSGREMALVVHGPRRRALSLQDGFTNHGGGKELSRRRVSGTGNDADGDAGPLPTPACTGHCDHTEGGQLSPPTVPPVQHYGALEGYERVTSYHLSVRQGGGTEETADGRRVDVLERRVVLSGLQQTSCYVRLVKIPGPGLDGGV